MSKPIPRRQLIAALAGDDLCRHCRGQGQIQVANERDRRTCPQCRGTGLAKAQS